MTKQCKNFIECMKDTIGNTKQPLFNGKYLDRVYYSDFGDTDNSYKNVLLMGKISNTRKRLKLMRLKLKH